MRVSQGWQGGKFIGKAKASGIRSFSGLALGLGLLPHEARAKAGCIGIIFVASCSYYTVGFLKGLELVAKA